MTNLPRALARTQRLAAVTALAALAVLVPAGAAQTPADQATPVGGVEDGDGPHPAHIHAGTCDQLGEVVYPLTDLAAPEGEDAGPDTAHAVKTSETLVDAPLEDIIDGGHAINVHLSAEEIGTYIACGDISGVVFVDEDDGERQMVIGLGELNESGHAGIAWLSEEGDQTEVAVNLIEPDEMR